MALIGAQLEGVVTTPLVLNGDEVTFTVLDVPIVVRRTAQARRRLRTPTKQKRMTLEQLAMEDPLPGRAEAGFLGCTGIIVGNYDTSLAPGARGVIIDYGPPATDPPDPLTELHPFLEIGPPETLLLGPCTRNDAEFHVNGVRVQVLEEGADPGNRIVAEHPKNEFGIDVDWRKIAVGELVSVEGYPSTVEPNLFIGFTVIVDSLRTVGLLSRPNESQIGVTRAQGRNRKGLFDLEVRGGLYLGPGPALGPRQRVEIHRLAADGTTVLNPLGSDGAVVGPEGFGKWTFGKNLTPTPAFPFAPVGVKAVYANPPQPPGANQEVGDGDPDVDIRDDPKAPPTAATPP